MHQIESVSHGAIMKGINVSKMKNIIIMLPPLSPALLCHQDSCHRGAEGLVEAEHWGVADASCQPLAGILCMMTGGDR